MGYWIGIATGWIVLGGFFAIVLGLGIPVDDTPENTGEKGADLAEMPAPLPSDFPPFHSSGDRL